MRKYFSPILAGLGLVTSFTSTASAHIRMLDPQPRYEVQGETGIKSCPCGLGGSNRICNVAQDGSDDARSGNVTRLEAGSTVTLRFEEFVDHAGRFRVAFDPDGADMADFNSNVLMDMPDPRGTGGQVWEMEVKLPDTTCTNCTLQLVQAMEVDTETPIADPAPVSSYYSCVDIELVAPGTLGNPPTAPDQPGAEQPGSEQPGAEQPGNQPGAEQPGAEQPGNEQPGAEEPGAEQPGAEQPGDDTEGMQPGSQVPQNGGAQSGGNAAGQGAGTPLIPAGSGAPMDVGSSGSSTGSGQVAMNGVPSVAPSGNIGSTLPPPPSLAGSGTESEASGGCALASGASGSTLGGVGLLGLLAALGLQRRARRSAR